MLGFFACLLINNTHINYLSSTFSFMARKSVLYGKRAIDTILNAGTDYRLRQRESFSQASSAVFTNTSISIGFRK